MARHLHTRFPISRPRLVTTEGPAIDLARWGAAGDPTARGTAPRKCTGISRHMTSTAIAGRALHNVWVQILAEFGLVGSVFIVWLLVDFWCRNTALRRPEFVEYWAQSTKGIFKLDVFASVLKGDGRFCHDRNLLQPTIRELVLQCTVDQYAAFYSRKPSGVPA